MDWNCRQENVLPFENLIVNAGATLFEGENQQGTEESNGALKETNSSSFLFTIKRGRTVRGGYCRRSNHSHHSTVTFGRERKPWISSFYRSPQCGWCGKMVLSQCWMTYHVAENRTGPVE